MCWKLFNCLNSFSVDGSIQELDFSISVVLMLMHPASMLLPYRYHAWTANGYGLPCHLIYNSLWFTVLILLIVHVFCRFPSFWWYQVAYRGSDRILSILKPDDRRIERNKAAWSLSDEDRGIAKKGNFWRFVSNGSISEHRMSRSQTSRCTHHLHTVIKHPVGWCMRLSLFFLESRQQQWHVMYKVRYPRWPDSVQTRLFE